MTTWFISDHHFGHKNILEFEDRPYDTIEEMQASMIAAHNAVVKKTDTVYIVGDFCFGSHNEWIEILDELKGNIILVKGNHDKTKVINRVQKQGYFHELHEVGVLIPIEKKFFYVTHFPFAIGERPQYFNISGHIHGRPSDYINQINVGVDSPFTKGYLKDNELPFGTPISFEYILEKAEALKEAMSEKYEKGRY